MRIASIRLKNFKNFRDACIDEIPGFCVIVGANGSGKSTMFDVFGFLKDSLTFNVRQALQARGGFHEVISRGVDPHESIEIELCFRMEIAGVERLVTYLLQIGLHDRKPVVRHEVLRYKRGRDGSPFHFIDFANGTGSAVTNEEDVDKQDHDRKPVVRREVLRYKRGRDGSPFHFIDFANGTGSAVTNEEDVDKQDDALEREQQSVAPDALSIKGLGQFERFKAANALRQLLENWHVSDFHINLARGSKDAIGESNHLSVTGDNLQLVAHNLYENEPDRFAKIVSAMQHRVPGVSDVEPVLTQDGRLILRFQDEQFTDPFIDRYVSDGTIKLFAYLVLLYDPDPHPLLCVEEPENQLYPTLLWELAEEFRAYAEQGGQVLVSTHSPDFLNATQLDEVYWLVREQGSTKVKRARDDEQIAAFIAEGDQMGYLWKEGFFRGLDHNDAFGLIS